MKPHTAVAVVSEARGQMKEKQGGRPVRIVLANGEIRYEVRAAVYLSGKRKRLRRRFKNEFEAEAFLAKIPGVKPDETLRDPR